ncbi:MAG: hypothetical protein HYR58_01750 [Acidobacteria bacterium]|nr:hypothetical protein [Acidobacteriota bacterium]
MRVAKKVGTQTTWYVTAERNPTGYAQVIHEQSTVSGSSFEPVREYVYAGSQMVATLAGCIALHFSTDS